MHRIASWHKWSGPVVAGLLAVVALAACSSVAPGETLESRAQALDKSLMCPVCPGETIDQSQVQLADQMQAAVREMLAEGRTEEEILDFFVERYGEGVLAAPRARGFNLLVWVVPPVGVLAGLAGIYLVLRSMSRGRGDQGPSQGDGDEAVDPDLDPYLDLVDREIGGPRGAPDGGASGGAVNG